MTMSNTTLRELAKAHANGNLNREAYRHARTKYIEGILSGEAPLQVNEYPPLVRAPAEESLEATEQQKKKRTPPVIPEPEPDKAIPRNLVAYLSAGIAVVVVIAVLVIVIPRAEQTSENSASSESQSSTQPATLTGLSQTQGTAAATTLIQSFIKENNWSDTSMDSFLKGWGSLPQGDKSGVQDSIEFSQLSNAIYKQLLEERALSGLGDADAAISKQRQLIQFAEKIGISDQRITLPKSMAGPETEDDLADDTDSTDEQLKQESMATPDEEILDESTSTDTKIKSSHCKSSLLNNRQAYCRDEINGVGKGPTMVVIPTGDFVMGEGQAIAQTAREVFIHFPFAMSVHETTYGEYLLFCKALSRNCPTQPWTGSDYPVVNVSWHDAVAYTSWLSDKTGNKYRLPSEAEWEYTARAGTSTIYPFGNNITATDAVFANNNKVTAPLPKTDRSINRNKFKLYHMVGNVREWVADPWHNNPEQNPPGEKSFTSGNNLEHVVRGGSYADSASALRSGARTKLPAMSTDNFTGFRVVQEL